MKATTDLRAWGCFIAVYLSCLLVAAVVMLILIEIGLLQ